MDFLVRSKKPVNSLADCRDGVTDGNLYDGDYSETSREDPEMKRRLEPPPLPEVPKENRLHQVVDGAKNVASRAQHYYDNTVAPAFDRSGARDFYADKVAPTAKNAAQSVKRTVADQHAKLASTPISRAAIALLIVSVLTIGSTFLPMGPTSIGRYVSAARNIADGNFDGAGGLVLVQGLGFITALLAATVLRILLFITAIASGVAIALRSVRPKKIAAIAGLLTGALGVFIGLVTVVITSRLDNMPFSAGTMLLLICSVAVGISAFILRRSTKKRPVSQPMTSGLPPVGL